MSNETGLEPRNVVYLLVLAFKGVLIREAGSIKTHLIITRIELPRTSLLAEYNLSMHNRREVEVVTEEKTVPLILN
jgi:hypothetical protein